MTKTVVLTLGRLPKALDIARAFHAAGWRVVVAEPFSRHLTGASRRVARSVATPAPADDHAGYLDALALLVVREQADLVVPVSEETMHVAFLQARLGPGRSVFTMPPDLVLALHDKFRFTELAQRFRTAVPETYRLGDPRGVALAASGPVVVKPVHSCSGRGVRVITAGQALPDPDAEDPAIVQRFAAGALLSSCTIAQGGRAVCTVIYRAVQLSGTVAIAFERIDHPAAEDWINRFVAGAGYTGFISFDLIVDEAGVVRGIECNPRVTSGIHFLRPEDIVAAILDPEADLPRRFRPNRQLQQFYSTLTELQGAMFRRGRGYWQKLGILLGTRDVSWDLRDPWPFFSMTWTSWPIISRALREHRPFGEVATQDIDWRGH